MYILLFSLTVCIKYLATYHFNLFYAEVQATISKTVDQVQTKDKNPLVTKANSVKDT